MSSLGNPSFTLRPAFLPIAQQIGLTADTVFTSPLIVPWRKLDDRENCMLATTLADGSTIRWHVKRFPASTAARHPAAAEVTGLEKFEEAGIASATLVGWGELADGRSFVITQDLAGYTPADKWIAAGHSFDAIIQPTADLAAKLHRAGLHHRDLYLCHFLVSETSGAIDLKLIDAARVGRMIFFTAGRWIVKDVAQFWYSTLALPITDEQRDSWLRRYAEQRGMPGPLGLRSAVLRKSARIARHDRSLRARQPHRNISLPT